MSKAILVIDMPSCCNECRFLNDNYDYPECIATGETRGYNFKVGEKRMDKCPLRAIPEKYETDRSKCSDPFYEFEFEYGYNQCIDEIIGGQRKRYNYEGIK